MILTDRFVFVHLGKCAGTALADFFVRRHGGRSFGHSHSGCSEIPKDKLSLPVVTGIRNPWDYYVSRYHFDLDQENSNHALDGLKDSSDSFKNWMMKFFYGDVESNNVDFGFLREHEIGIFTFRFIYTCYPEAWDFGSFEQDSIGVDYFLPVELLTSRLVSFLVKMGLSPDVSSLGRMNQSVHRDYRHYYDDELIETVRHHERHIIDYFGYEFDGAVVSLRNLTKGESNALS